MGRKGQSGHLKRKPAPKLWPIHRKEDVWTVMPKPGPHSLSRSLPLALVVRDILGFAKTAKEAKNIISQGKILVDGKVRRDERFLVGLMDIISVPETKKYYRILPSTKSLFLHPIDDNEAKFKLYRIEDKTIVKGGKTDLNLHDGTSLLIDAVNAATLEKDVYNTLDVLKLSIPDRELLGYNKLIVGAPALIIGGKNMGTYGIIDSIEKQTDKKRRDLLVTLKDAKGQQFQTILDFVFVLGERESL
ncbi:MAG: 30S ribosomal protein S4e, partial [Candidatus Bathyarchaeota archaeon]